MVFRVSSSRAKFSACASHQRAEPRVSVGPASLEIPGTPVAGVGFRLKNVAVITNRQELCATGSKSVDGASLMRFEMRLLISTKLQAKQSG